FDPVPSRPIRTMGSRMIHRTRATGRNPLDAFNHIERPRHHAANSRPPPRGILDHGLDQAALDRPRVVGAHRPASMDRCNDIHFALSGRANSAKYRRFLTVELSPLSGRATP